MASLNLPAALEETSGETVPQSLVDKSQAVIDLGGIKRLEAMISELPSLLQRNKEILIEVLIVTLNNYLTEHTNIIVL